MLGTNLAAKLKLLDAAYRFSPVRSQTHKP